MFESIIIDGVFTVQTTLICLLSALILGIMISAVYMQSGRYTKSFAITLVLLPAIVHVVIALVNGNLGTGIAVVGAFSLVRFRSVAGRSIEICYIFFAMAIGLAIGMGYIFFAVCIAVVLCAAMLLLSKTPFAETPGEKRLTVSIPENLDYTEVFDDLFEKYTKTAKLQNVKTTNLGSMFELKYLIRLKDPKTEKAFIDEIRCRNGNLTVMCTHEIKDTAEEL